MKTVYKGETGHLSKVMLAGPRMAFSAAGAKRMEINVLGGARECVGKIREGMLFPEY